ncbi:hypothetical protein CK203_060338 [Vitis vinifera]|uniref:Uncharacterized protein n=1 Tax=Vitis vinifera TaxID=29760 RepID=A0A438FRZ5_VITVI|nr:hypothetical protein CK203_060338 [Vitis vinifera]
MSLPVLPIPLPPPLSCVLEPAILISTPAVPTSDLLKLSQPQVADATLSALSIMAHLDTLQKLFVSIDSRIDACLKVDGNTNVIGSGSNTRALTVDDVIFIHTTDSGVDIIIKDDPPMVQVGGEAITPIVEITNQATTPILEDID